MKLIRKSTPLVVIALLLSIGAWIGLRQQNHESAPGISTPDVSVDQPALPDNSGQPSAAPALIERIFPRHIVASRQTQTENGQTEQVAILRTGFKYPLIRTVTTSTTKGEKETTQIMVADQLIVRPSASVSIDTFRARVQSMGFALIGPVGTGGDQLIRFPLEEDPARSLDRAEARLREAEDLVDMVEPDYIVTTSALPAGEAVLASGQLWALHNTGRDNGVAGADMDAVAAWDIISDATNIVVAIIDSGINLTHHDLAANLWNNPAEIAGNGIDDDGNGIIDDVHGYNAYAGDGSPVDDNGHGTHCAGIIAADGHNAGGYTGVAWSTRLMALKFLSADGAGATSDAIAAIDYAVGHGARILNLSWGGDGYSSTLRLALQRARDAGVIAVAAAGNDARNTDYSRVYPAGYDLDNIVPVGSTDRRDTLSWFSNYGPASVRIAAPGEDILSTWIGGDAASKTLSGTSMAAAEVSGALTLVAAHHTGDNHRQLINRLLGGAETISGLPVYRQGRLNLYNALAVAAASPVNDNLADADASALNGVSWRGYNTDATTESGEPAHVSGGPAHSVWYRWTSPASGPATLIFSPDFAGRACVYTGDSVEQLAQVASMGSGSQTFAATSGVVYQIAVDGESGATGTFSLSLSIPPGNDNKADATVISGDSWDLAGTNLGATLEPNESAHANVPGGHSVWWRWSAPLDGPLRISTDGSEYDTTLAVYDVTSGGPTIQGDAPDVILAIDVSGSVDTIARTSYIGDTNGDGRANTILDAEIAAATALHQTLIAGGRPTRVAVVAFDDTATLLDMNPVAAGVQTVVDATADEDINGVPDVVQALRTLRKGGTTNYTAALTKVAETFLALGTPADEGNLVFLSDGKPSDSGDFGSIAETLRADGHLLQAFGAGSGSSLAALQIISPDALIFTDISELLAVFNGAVAANDDHGGVLTSEVNFNARSGHTYLIAVDGYKGASGIIRLSGRYSQDIQIVSQPSDLSVDRFSQASFSVTARGVAPFNYQWFKNGLLIPDATEPTYTIASADIAEEADYHVVVNNTFASVRSRDAHLSVIIHEPVITQDLLNQSAVAGSRVEFSARVVGTGPFTYQWYKDGDIIDGATSATLVIASASAADAGTYHVTITNASGTATSKTVSLSLADDPFNTWVRRSPEFAPHGVINVAFLDGRFFVHGYKGLIAVSSDGLSWTDARVPGTYFGEGDNRNVTIQTVTLLNGIYFALGQSGSGTYALLRSDNGLDWEQMPNEERLSTLDYLDGVYVGSGIDQSGYTTCYASTDLEIWTPVAQFGREQFPLLASGATWKYLPNVTSYPNGWTSTSFNDSAWSSGPSPLGFGNPDAVTTVPSGGTTTLFRITLPSAVTYDGVRIHGSLRVDDGASIYFNGGIVRTLNMNSTFPGLFDRASTDVSGTAESAYTDFSSLYTHTLQSSNVFAVEVHQSFDHPEDMIFDLNAYAEAFFTTVGPVAGNGRLVVMRGDGKSFTSTDGVNWTRHDNNGLDNAASGQFIAPTRMRFINGRFLAWTATGKRLYASTDGVTWTLQTGNLQPDNFGWDGQTYYYIGSTVRTSTDAATWNFRMLPGTYGTDLKPDAGVYGNGIYVLVNGEGKSAVTARLADITGSLMSYSHSQGRRLRILNGSLVSIADNSAVDSRTWMSNSGSDWTPVLTAGSDLSYGRDTYLQFAFDTPMLRYDLTAPSLTSEGWILGTDPRTPGFTPTSHIFADGLFVAVGPDGAIATSQDAKVWSSARAADVADPDLTRIDYLGDRFIAIGRSGLMLTSEDAVNWTKTTLATTANLKGAAFNGTRYVVGTDNAAETEFFVSSDTVTWTRVAAGAYEAVRDITHGDGRFAAVTGQRVMFSEDGFSWSYADLPNDEGWAIAYYKDTFVVVGDKASILQSGSVDTTSPAPVASGLAEGAVLTSNDPISVRVDGDASGSPIVSVDFILDGEVVSRVSGGPFVWSSAAGLPGEHRLSIVARDAEGNVSFDHVTFTVNFSPWQQVSPALPSYFVDTFTAPDGTLYGLGGESLSVGKSSAIARSRDGLDWRRVYTGPNEYDLVRMAASGSGRLVATGNEAFVLTSDDGETWTKTTLPYAGVCLAWGNGLFVAMPGANPSGACISLDGLKWDQVDFGSKIFGDSISDLTFRDGTFLLATRVGDVFSSHDGITWSKQTPTPLWSGYRYPKFVKDSPDLTLVAYDVFTHTAVSGWQQLARPEGQSLSRLVYTDGKFVGTSTLGLHVSIDLIDWTRTYTAASESDPMLLAGLAFVDDRWIACYKSSTMPFFASSDDTVTWQRHLYVDNSVSQRSTSRGLGDIATDGEQLLAVGAYGLLQRSTDGRTWSQLPYIGNESLSTLVYAENKWVAAGTNGAVYTSPDGAAWTKRTTDTTRQLLQILHNGDRFVIYGDRVILTSDDAETWTAVTTVDGASVLATFGGIVTQGRFLLISNGNVLYASDDGVTWHGVGLTLQPSVHHYRVVDTADGVLIAGGYHSYYRTNYIYRSSDLLNWSTVYENMPAVYKPEAAIGDTRFSTQDSGDGDFRFSLDEGTTWFSVDNRRGYSGVAAFKGSYYAVSGDQRIDFFSLVDLGIDAASATTDVAPGPGSPLHVEWDVTNHGYIDYTDSQAVRIEVRIGTSTGGFDADDIVLVDETFSASITTDEALNHARDFTLPSDIPVGDYHLKIRVDGFARVSELNESNNTYISALPVFSIKSWTLSLIATPGGVVRSAPGNGVGSLSAVRGSSSGYVTLGARTLLANRSTIDLVAVPNKGFGFVGWLEYPSQGFESLSLEMDRDRTVTPLFSPLRTVDIAILGQGTVTLTPDDGNYVDGDPLTLHALPADGWRFVSWGGSLTGGDPTASVTVSGDASATATFAPVGVSLQDWRQAKFGAEANNPLLTADDADPDVDGRPNLLEYALGDDPLLHDSGPAWHTLISDDQLTLIFVLDQQAVDALVRVEATDDLNSPGSWNDDLVTIEVIAEDTQTKTLKAQVPLSGAVKFMRLHIER